MLLIDVLPISDVFSIAQVKKKNNIISSYKRFKKKSFKFGYTGFIAIPFACTIAFRIWFFLKKKKKLKKIKKKKVWTGNQKNRLLCSIQRNRDQKENRFE